MKRWLISLFLLIALISTIVLIQLPPVLPNKELESQPPTVLQTELITPFLIPRVIPWPPTPENHIPTGAPFISTPVPARQQPGAAPTQRPAETILPDVTPVNDPAEYPGGQITPMPLPPATLELTLAMLINRQRQQVGVMPLTLTAALNRAAYSHSVDMSTQVSPWHVGSDGSNGGTRMFAAGYDWEDWSEIIGWGFADPQAMVDWWLNHAEHRAILLSSAFTEFGIGYAAVANAPWQNYWTVNFGQPRVGADLLVQVATPPPLVQVATPPAIEHTFQPIRFTDAEELATPLTTCPLYSQRVYTLIPLEAVDRSHPAPLHADLNLRQRGYSPVTVQAHLVDLPGPVDVDAPQLFTLFVDPPSLQFTTFYQIYDWDWQCSEHGCRGELLTTPETTLLGLATQPGLLLRAPTRQASIYGESYVATVLYAEPTRLTLAYTRDGSVANGYTVHVEQICVDPNLLHLYQEADQNGREQLPALEHNQIFGTALSTEVRLAIRDRGAFLDPRSRKDWWRGF